MRPPKVVCALIVGPGEADRYLARTLANVRAWADWTCVYADHVDVPTREVLMRAVSHKPHFLAIGYSARDGSEPTMLEDEGFVRNALFKQLDLLARDGDLIVVLDADEQLNNRQGPVRTVLERLQAPSRGVRAWSMRFLHLWTPDGSMYRSDGGWAPAPQDRIYVHKKGLRVEPRQLACRAIPEAVQPRAESPLEVLHWGYARPEDRHAKYERYMQIDGGRFHSRAHLESILQEPVLAAV